MEFKERGSIWVTQKGSSCDVGKFIRGPQVYYDAPGENEFDLRIVVTENKQLQVVDSSTGDPIQSGTSIIRDAWGDNTLRIASERFSEKVNKALASFKPKWAVGDWFRVATDGRYKIVRVIENSLDAIYYNEERHIIESRNFGLRGLGKCDPPAPNFMTPEELKERLIITGDKNKDTLLALDLSIEKAKRNNAWLELQPELLQEISIDSDVCALCTLFNAETSYGRCPLARYERIPCTGSCCDEWVGLRNAKYSERPDAVADFIKHGKDLIALMESKRRELVEGMKTKKKDMYQLSIWQPKSGEPVRLRYQNQFGVYQVFEYGQCTVLLGDGSSVAVYRDEIKPASDFSDWED